MGIDDAESSSRKTVREINRAAIQVGAALWINRHHGPIALGDFVAWLRSSETHCVLQSGTAAFLHGETQTG
jgi:hypothetical protein